MEHKVTEKPNFRNLILQCQECRADFLLQTGEQLFYFGRGLAMPKRCPDNGNPKS
jgi:hypothetical protein